MGRRVNLNLIFVKCVNGNARQNFQIKSYVFSWKVLCGVLQVVTEERDPKDKLNFGKDI